MSTRCPDCNKWASLEMQDPEVQSLEVDVQDDHLTVTAEVRIVRNCADCSTEMKEAQLSMEVEVNEGFACKCAKGKGEYSVDEDSVDVIEEGGGRYAKSFFGATVNATVTCDKCKATVSVELSDKVPASGMDELN